MNVCVYCSSSNAVNPAFFEAAVELGRLLAGGGHTLVYGGGSRGLMGALARAVHEHGGRVVGIIPDALRRIEGVAYEVADELIITRDLRERKGLMDGRADAFVVLPGGFGTLEELLEILTLKQLGYHEKPIVIVNANRFYDPLVELFEHFYREQFARTASRSLYEIVPDPASAVSRLASPAATPAL